MAIRQGLWAHPNHKGNFDTTICFSSVISVLSVAKQIFQIDSNNYF